jgi:uncharacterized protein (DUF1800 family)
VSVSRRVFLAGTAAAAAGLTACDGVYSNLSRRLAGGVPATFARPDGDATDPDFRLLQRTSFGPAPGDLDRVRAAGRQAWIEEQLHPERIDDLPCDLLVRRFESLGMTPGDMHEFKRSTAEDEIARATMIRAVHSRRQLFEVMTDFWSDHLNIFHGKDECILYKTPDDRDVVRAHVFGKFRDLIRSSALSPAMLVYLDGRTNRKGKPNENYARELLELHTLGVHGGYTQKDVMETARALTGWDVRHKGQWMKGKVEFHPDRHDNGEKTILGTTLPADGGAEDLDRVVDLVTGHPSTAKHLATKLCRRLIADDPPAALVDRVAARFSATGGDLRETTREALGGLDQAQPRLKRPFRFVVSALRGLAASTQGKHAVREPLRRMGQAPFQYPTPDGYPDDPEPWLGTMIWRWRFALELSQGRVGDATVGIPVTDVPALFAHLVGRRPDPKERAALEGAADPKEALALVLAGPAFQWY